MTTEPSGTLPVLGVLAPWADPTIIQLNRLPAHTPLGGFDRTPLDGQWQLEMFGSPGDVPAEALVGSRPDAVGVPVPANWTMVDLGPFVDVPHYTNIQMPFDGPPPELPDRNPTGVYRRTFEAPASADAAVQVVLGVEGAEGVHGVYVNGAFAGYGTDSRLPSEYDITSLLRPGINNLAIVVVKYSAHSYVEDQDQWWMGGLHRPVWVESRPTVCFADLPATTSYDPETGAGSIGVDAVVDFDGRPKPGWTVEASLFGPDGTPTGEPTTAAVEHRHARPYGFEGFTATVGWDLPTAQPWSAERPDRYRVEVALVDPDGRRVHREELWLGVRSVEVANRQLVVNGEPVWIFGANRHDHHPDRGKAVTVDDMRADLIAMRRHNVTAVRTAHYPNRAEFYELCDELGFYVIDEANIESHAYNRSVCADPRYRVTWLERGARMVGRDRNHPCIIAWSLGNESGYGPHHDALAGWIRHTDPSRPLHYEDAVRVAGWDGGHAATDLVCPMYPEIDDIAAYGNGTGDRPLIMCEYSHAMGNSNGSLADYWDVILATPGLQGGFIWEWKDHGIRQHRDGVPPRLAYGGQFGDAPHDGNFVADGIMSADLVPHPGAAELAWVYRPVAVRGGESGGFVVENRRSFTDLSDLHLVVTALRAGESVATLNPPVRDVPPGSARSLDMDLPDGADTVRFEWRTVADAWFAPAGHVVSWDEVSVGDVAPGDVAPDAGSLAPIAAVLAPSIEPELTLWRAPVDNDGFKLMPDLAERLRVGGLALARWQKLGIDRRDPEELVEHRAEVVADDGRGRTTYRHVVEVPDELADLPRVGVRFALPATFDRVRWFGRGPHENYPDRNRSAMLGTWDQAPDDLPYLVPQEFGLRTDCRWVELIDSGSGVVVRIDVLGAPMAISATRYRAEHLYHAAHMSDIEPGPELIVHLDAAHRGLGTASCGPDVGPQYRLEAGRYDFGYQITVGRRAQDDGGDRPRSGS